MEWTAFCDLATHASIVKNVNGVKWYEWQGKCPWSMTKCCFCSSLVIRDVESNSGIKDIVKRGIPAMRGLTFVSVRAYHALEERRILTS